jgi:hypothetical protein
MSTKVTIEMSAEAAARLADPKVQEALRAALAAEGIPLVSIEPTTPHIEPCPKCLSREVSFTNCGYSSFDMATATCKCGHKIVTPGSDARPDWNAFADDLPSRHFLHWLLGDEGQQRIRMVGKYELVRKAASLYRLEPLT